MPPEPPEEPVQEAAIALSLGDVVDTLRLEAQLHYVAVG
jgi:hypothetical protein